MPPNPTAPQVVLVDDNPDGLQQQRDLLNDEGNIWIELRHPQDVTQDDLNRASVVLVDLVLDTWPERDRLTVLGLKPTNGLALLGVFQEHAHRAAARHACAFALHTGKMNEVRHSLADSEHIVARAHNLDWVFRKQDTGVWAQITSLARAVQALPSTWSTSDREVNVTAIKTWLALPPTKWSDRAWRDVEECHPPAHELAATTHGVAIVRWLLQRILPYPCFLVDVHHLAVRLRVDVTSLSEALDAGLKDWLAPARYDGQLAEFSGPRWWRSGVEALVFDLTSEGPADPSLLERKLREKVASLQSLRTREPVVVLNERYEALEELSDSATAVRIVPDDWPPFADQAWTTPELARDHGGLRAIVRLADQDRIAGGQEA